MQILYFFSVLLAIISAVVLVINPATGILVVFLSKPVIDTGFYVVFGHGLSLTRVFGVLFPLIIFVQMAAAKGYNRIRYMPLKTLWIIYAIDIFIFSSIIILNEGLVIGLDVFFRHINGFVGFYMLQAFLRTDHRLRQLIVAMIIAGLFRC